jgi:peptidoglycan/LPS O-acetylase OafA/YrhL
LSESISVPKSNNFDLIRLFAAAQVALMHSVNHLAIDFKVPSVTAAAGFFPGVPIFFFVSGFLISRSFERNPRVSEFAANRILRIYPALIVCLAVSILSVVATGYFRARPVAPDTLVAWIAAQVSVVQFFNPEFLRGYGVGVLNGSLWTISVELQFYVLIPCIYAALHSYFSKRLASNAFLLSLIMIFMLANRLYMWGAPRYGGLFAFEIVGVTFIPWVYMFLFGVLFQRNCEMIHRGVRGKFLPLLVIYCLVCWFASSRLGWVFGNSLHPALFVILIVLIFAAAYSNNRLSDRILRRNDISYGIYIYHMPVINLLLAERMGGSTVGLSIAIAVTIVLAFASWILIERPALALKKHPLYQHAPSHS